MYHPDENIDISHLERDKLYRVLCFAFLTKGHYDSNPGRILCGSAIGSWEKVKKESKVSADIRGPWEGNLYFPSGNINIPHLDWYGIHRVCTHAIMTVIQE